MPYRTGLVRVGERSSRPVEGASYESESERGRGVPSSRPRASRNAVEVHHPLFFGFAVFADSVSFFFIVDCGYPYSVGTDSYDKQNGSPYQRSKAP
jgi:hypothetical protein